MTTDMSPTGDKLSMFIGASTLQTKMQSNQNRSHVGSWYIVIMMFLRFLVETTQRYSLFPTKPYKNTIDEQETHVTLIILPLAENTELISDVLRTSEHGVVVAAYHSFPPHQNQRPYPSEPQIIFQPPSSWSV